MVVVASALCVVCYSFIKPLLEPQGLHRRQGWIFLSPRYLLPWTMFCAGSFQTLWRKVFCQRIAHVNPQVLFDEVSHGGPDEKLEWTINEMVSHPVVNVKPDAELICQPGLIQIAKP